MEARVGRFEGRVVQGWGKGGDRLSSAVREGRVFGRRKATGSPGFRKCMRKGQQRKKGGGSGGGGGSSEVREGKGRATALRL